MTARIILVDDHPVVLAGMQALLLDLPDLELVGLASCASEALALVRGERPDIAVLDMGLPGMSGLMLAERILEGAPDIRIVMLTHYEEPSYVQKALRVGVRGYVLKASAGEKVVQAIRTVLSGGVYIDAPHVVKKTEVASPDARLDYHRERRPENLAAGMWWWDLE